MIDNRSLNAQVAQVNMVIHIPEIKGIPSIPLGVYRRFLRGQRGIPGRGHT